MQITKPLPVSTLSSLITSLPSVSIIISMLVSTSITALAQDGERRPFRPDDVHRLMDVGDIAISPDGDWIAYSVGTHDVEDDEIVSDLFMVRWDGSERIRLTHTDDESESHPRFSPDGRHLAFIAARAADESAEEDDDPAAKSQVWLLNRAGGEARRLTGLPGGVSAFEWSPDSARLVLESMDPKDAESENDEDAGESPAHDTPEPIVIDRYRFKRDVVGYLGDRYQRLYIFDVGTEEASLLTPGPYDSTDPAWSPDGNVIAFTSKRHGDPDRNQNSDIYIIEASAGASPRQLTTWEGPDSDPVFSPDGGSIAYLQGGPQKYSGYDPTQVAVIAVEGGQPTLPAGELDRNMSSPRWSVDGESIHFLVADDRVQSVVRVPADGGAVTGIYPERSEPGVAESFEVGPKGLATVTSFGQRPGEIYRADGFALSDHNGDLLDEVVLASVEGYDAISTDGVRVGSMLLKPPGFRDGVAYPTIAYVHGGPVSQDAFQFDPISQALAAQGYLVVNPNYRGSSGRGREFSRGIYAAWGSLEIDDIHAVMDKLVEDGLADPDRLGIGGWSYGGINTNFAIATDSRFAAAVSGASASNYIAGYGTDQYIWQYENELGLPWESPDAYLRISYPFLHADRISTPTLFMCGELDFNVPLLNSEQMYQALRSLGVPTQLVIYPDQYHSLTTPSYIRDRLVRMIDWYDKHLDGAQN